MTDEQTAQSEATAIHPPCEHCHGPVTPPKRKGLVKRFCSDRCRANHRDQKIERAVALLVEVAEEVQGEMQRLDARLKGAQKQLLDAIGTRQPRKPRVRKPAGGL